MRTKDNHFLQHRNKQKIIKRNHHSQINCVNNLFIILYLMTMIPARTRLFLPIRISSMFASITLDLHFDRITSSIEQKMRSRTGTMFYPRGLFVHS